MTVASSRNTSLGIGRVVIGLALLLTIAAIGLLLYTAFFVGSTSDYPTPVNSYDANATTIASVPSTPIVALGSAGEADNSTPSATTLPSSTPANINEPLPTLLPTQTLAPELSAEDRRLFDRANNNTTTANSFQFSLTNRLEATVPGETVTLDLRLEGVLNDLLNNFSADLVADGSLMQSGAPTQTANSQTRFVNEVLYFQLPAQNADGTATMQWVGVPIESIFDEALTQADLEQQLDLSADQLATLPEEVTDLFNFQNYIRTSRAANTREGLARFQSQILIDDFLQSSDADAILDLLVSLGGLPPAEEQQLRGQLNTLREAPTELQPRITFNVDHLVDLTTETVRQVDVVVDVRLPGIVAGGSATEIIISLDSRLLLDGLGNAFSVSAPPDAVIFDASNLLSQASGSLP